MTIKEAIDGLEEAFVGAAAALSQSSAVLVSVSAPDMATLVRWHREATAAGFKGEHVLWCTRVPDTTARSTYLRRDKITLALHLHSELAHQGPTSWIESIPGVEP